MENNAIDVKIHAKQKDVINENNETINNMTINDNNITNLKKFEKSNKKLYLRIFGLVGVVVIITVIIIIVTLSTKKDKKERNLNPFNTIDSTSLLTTDLEDSSLTPTESTGKISKILIISTGGTFNSVPTDSGLQPQFNETDLRERLKPISDGCNLTFQNLFNIDSANFEPKHWKLISESIEEHYQSQDGIIIIHGTDTMAYTSSMLSHMLEGIPIPVVITGSQLGISDPLSDGLENMRLSIYMARSNYSGVYVVFNRKVILGKYASKTHSKSFSPFESINYDYFGEVNSEGLNIREELLPKIDPNFKVKNNMSENVFLLKLTPGLKPSIIDILIEEGYKGIIIESYGLGGLPNTEGNDFGSKVKLAIEKGIKIVILSQCTYDGVDLDVYETGVTIKDAGIINMPLATKEYAYTRLIWELGNNN